MAILTSELVNAWTDKDRYNLTTLDATLADQIAAQVIGQASQAFDTATWVSSATTPDLIKSVMAMLYVGRVYQARNIDTVDDISFYGSKLILDAEALLENIISGATKITLNGVVLESIGSANGALIFEPTESEPLFYMDMLF